eukprot:scaffold2893_cov254-Pinguiococcus_pyrenoidosus.AAC.12
MAPNWRTKQASPSAVESLLGGGGPRASGFPAFTLLYKPSFRCSETKLATPPQLAIWRCQRDTGLPWTSRCSSR